MRFAAVALAAAGICYAGALTGPVPGFIVDSRTGSIRPVLGIPGGMQLGPSINLPFQIASADFDPGGNFAVAVSTEVPSHLYFLQNLGNPVIADLGPVADKTALLAINSSGQVALLGAPGQLQFLTGLPSAPVLGNAIPTQALLGPISAAVLDEAGQCGLLGTSADSTGALETLCSDGTTQRIVMQQGMRISAIAILNQAQDAILADTAGQRILRVSNYRQSSIIATLAAAGDGITTPIGIQVNRQQAVVADSAASAVFLIDLSGQAPIQTISLNSQPSRTKFMTDRSVLLLSDPSSAMFTIFDLQAMQSFFIPTN